MTGDTSKQPPDGEARVDGGATRVVMIGRSTPQGLEQLRLEIRRLARGYGAQLTEFQIESLDEIDLLT